MKNALLRIFLASKIDLATAQNLFYNPNISSFGRLQIALAK